MSVGASEPVAAADAIARALVCVTEPGDRALEHHRLHLLWALISVPIDLVDACAALGLDADESRIDLGLAVRTSWWSWDEVYRLFRIVAKREP